MPLQTWRTKKLPKRLDGRKDSLHCNKSFHSPDSCSLDEGGLLMGIGGDIGAVVISTSGTACTSWTGGFFSVLSSEESAESEICGNNTRSMTYIGPFDVEMVLMIWAVSPNPSVIRLPFTFTKLPSRAVSRSPWIDSSHETSFNNT